MFWSVHSYSQHFPPMLHRRFFFNGVNLFLDHIFEFVKLISLHMDITQIRLNQRLLDTKQDHSIGIVVNYPPIPFDVQRILSLHQIKLQLYISTKTKQLVVAKNAPVTKSQSFTGDMLLLICEACDCHGRQCIGAYIFVSLR